MLLLLLRRRLRVLPEILTPGKNITHLATDNINMAAYRFASGDVDGAHVSAREGLRWARQAQYPLLIAIALQHLALLATQRLVNLRNEMRAGTAATSKTLGVYEKNIGLKKPAR